MAGQPHKRPPLPAILLVLLLIGGGVYWWWTTTQPASQSTGLVASGQVESRQYQIASAVSGRVTKVGVVEGTSVKKGQELVRLDQAALKLQLTQAREGVTAAKAAVTNARDDGTTADVKAAKARLAQAEAAVDLAKVQLGYTVVKAPRAGRVVSVVTNTGQNAAPGRTLLTVVDPKDLFVRVFVPQTEIGNVKVGQTATAITDSSTRSFSGTVSFIASQAEFTPNNVQTKEQRVKLVYEVRVTVRDATGTLKAGMPVDVTFA